jgi:signal transduction histidine kinase
VSAILEAVDRLSKLIDDVLALTQGDVSGIPLEKERVDLGGLCRMAVDAVQGRAVEKEQKLEIDVSPATGFVFGDVRRLRESVEHVLNNAIAYTDRKGRIRLEASGDEENAVVRIIDNGIGISKQDLPRVFERFDRINETGVRGEAALGLGLPLTRQFVEAHGGSVELESKKGKGTTVALTIPRGSK